MIRHLPFIAILLVVTGCAAINKADPAQHPTADYPCTPSGVVCSTVPLACCGQGDTCGGSFPHVGCPDDSCCYIGSDDMNFSAASSNAGPRPMKVRGKQWAPTTAPPRS
jgi:hypothetical protein